MTMLLAFDTTAGACSAALWADGGAVAHRCEPMARGHAEALVPMIVAVLGEAGCAARDLDAIGVTVGPGAFTGLRIGLSAARGMALAVGVPALGVTSLEALAHGATPEERAGRTVLAAIDTKRGDLYVQAFDESLAPITGPSVASPEAALAAAGDSVLVVGDGVIGGCARGAADPWPDARVVAALAAGRLPDRGAGPPPPRALYLREPEARLPEPAPGS